MAWRCTECGEVVAEERGAPARPLPLRSLCPECLNPDDLEPADLSAREQGAPPAPGRRCPACGRIDTLRPLRPSEALTYRICSSDGYAPEFCTRMVMVRYALEG
jgi:hypothetical protein